ncbi:MAG: formylglycine-generating enzyme family protein [Planctomycetota bacterium]|nr:formylglycine-generating enzyme family protein [Planctomycetota bacterium]
MAADRPYQTINPFLQTPGWTRALKTADLTVWLAEGVPLPFQEIPAGEFWMGSRGYASDEEPRHLVRITRPFYLSSFPVTQHQWRAVAARFEDEGLEAKPSHFAGELHPVEQVSWNDATQWCRVLQTSDLLANLRDRRGNPVANPQVGLPNEAQWEYACRAGTEVFDKIVKLALCAGLLTLHIVVTAISPKRPRKSGTTR